MELNNIPYSFSGDKPAFILDYALWPLLLTWFNFNPNMDK